MKRGVGHGHILQSAHESRTDRRPSVAEVSPAVYQSDRRGNIFFGFSVVFGCRLTLPGYGEWKTYRIIPYGVRPFGDRTPEASSCNLSNFVNPRSRGMPCATSPIRCFPRVGGRRSGGAPDKAAQ